MQTKKDYEGLIGTTFLLPLEEGELVLTLTEVSHVTAEKTEEGQSEPFSIIFESTLEDHVEQGTYTLTHQELGEVLIFIVPIGPADAGMRYEAIFT